MIYYSKEVHIYIFIRVSVVSICLALEKTNKTYSNIIDSHKYVLEIIIQFNYNLIIFII